MALLCRSIRYSEKSSNLTTCKLPAVSHRYDRSLTRPLLFVALGHVMARHRTWLKGECRGGMIVEACSSFSGPQSLRNAKSIVRTLLLIRREPASRFIHLDLSSLVFVPKELNTRSKKHSMFMQVHFQPNCQCFVALKAG